MPHLFGQVVRVGRSKSKQVSLDVKTQSGVVCVLVPIRVAADTETLFQLWRSTVSVPVVAESGQENRALVDQETDYLSWRTAEPLALKPIWQLDVKIGAPLKSLRNLAKKEPGERVNVTGFVMRISQDQMVQTENSGRWRHLVSVLLSDHDYAHVSVVFWDEYGMWARKLHVKDVVCITGGVLVTPEIVVSPSKVDPFARSAQVVIDDETLIEVAPDCDQTRQLEEAAEAMIIYPEEKRAEGFLSAPNQFGIWHEPTKSDSLVGVFSESKAEEVMAPKFDNLDKVAREASYMSPLEVSEGLIVATITQIDLDHVVFANCIGCKKQVELKLGVKKEDQKPFCYKCARDPKQLARLVHAPVKPFFKLSLTLADHTGSLEHPLMTQDSIRQLLGIHSAEVYMTDRFQKLELNGLKQRLLLNRVKVSYKVFWSRGRQQPVLQITGCYLMQETEYVLWKTSLETDLLEKMERSNVCAGDLWSDQDDLAYYEADEEFEPSSVEKRS